MLSHVWFAKDIKTAILAANVIVNEWGFKDYQLHIYGALDKSPVYSAECQEILASKSLGGNLTMMGTADPKTVLATSVSPLRALCSILANLFEVALPQLLSLRRSSSSSGRSCPDRSASCLYRRWSLITSSYRQRRWLTIQRSGCPQRCPIFGSRPDQHPRHDRRVGQIRRRQAR